MIAELLNPTDVRSERELLISRLTALAEKMDKDLALGKKTDPTLTPDKIRRVASELEKEATDEKLAPADQKLEAGAYIPRAPLTCVLQSIYEQQFRERGWIKETPGLRGLAAADVAVTTERLSRPLQAARGLAFGGFEDGEDVRYLVDGMAGVLDRLIAGKANFNSKPAQLAELGKNARVLIFGDWATGLPRARALADAIATELRENQADWTQHLIHLGDTYYAGRSSEYQRRFLPHWPKPGVPVKSQWSLNGNHDMYSGGDGYFNTLLANELFQSHKDNSGKPSSFFLLQNEHWQIFGLDSAFHSPQLTGMDGAIDAAQADFVKERLDPAKGVILLTHHQLFSARQGEGNSEQIRDALKARGIWKNVRGWIWGHEHRAVLYAPSWSKAKYDLSFALCLGNSGVPTERKTSDIAPGAVEWEYLETMRSGTKHFMKFAFISLEFGDAKPDEVKVKFHRPDRSVAKETSMFRREP